MTDKIKLSFQLGNWGICNSKQIKFNIVQWRLEGASDFTHHDQFTCHQEYYSARVSCCFGGNFIKPEKITLTITQLSRFGLETSK